jgi:hypothetical protein
VSSVTFAISPPNVPLPADSSFTQVASKDVPAGDWAVVAYANTRDLFDQDDHVRDVGCELRSGGGTIGSAIDRRVTPAQNDLKRNLSLNGGASLPAGGTISLWCFSQEGRVVVVHAQVMIMKVGGFF